MREIAYNQMRRKTKAIINSLTSIIYQLITIICGFILPHCFLSCYGSEVYGLMTSITQILGIISLAECGVGAVVQSALYKPLSVYDNVSVSKIVSSSDNFFRKIAYILLIYTIVLVIIYPKIVEDTFGTLYTVLLILVIFITMFVQYYIGMTYKLLFIADQSGYIQYILHSVLLLVNTLLSIYLMKNNYAIHIVKLISSFVFIIQPIALFLLAKKRYRLIYNIKYEEEPIKQKWNGFAQHIASVVLNNADIAILTIMSTLENVSIYSVYYLVVNGVKQIVVSITNGMQAMLGNMYARKEMNELQKSFNFIEWLLHTIVTFVFSATVILIIPFIKVYTKEITDVNYIAPLFAYLITIAQATYCIRLPYNIMILAAGHYKQTQVSAIMEAVINVLVSIVLVYQYGLIGVSIGTFVAMLYRTLYLVYYLSKNILYRRIRKFVYQLFVDIVSAIIIFVLAYLFSLYSLGGHVNYISWIMLALKLVVVEGIVIVVVNYMAYKINIIGIKDEKRFT